VFGRNRKHSAGDVNTVLGEGSIIKGSLVLEGSIRIDGDFEGERIVTKDTLILSGKGKIKGNVVARMLISSGKIMGNIRATDCVEILSGGEIIGDIRTPSLILEEGAFFVGNCLMEKKGRPEDDTAVLKAESDLLKIKSSSKENERK